MYKYAKFHTFNPKYAIFCLTAPPLPDVPKAYKRKALTIITFENGYN